MPQTKIKIFQFPSILGHEKTAVEATTSLATQMGFSTSQIDNLRTAVSEACLNAIEHGNQQNASLPVTLILTPSQTTLQIDIIDQGPGPKTISQQRPNLSKKLSGEEHSRGWGLFLIQNLVDELHITQTPQGHNQTRLIIHI